MTTIAETPILLTVDQGTKTIERILFWDLEWSLKKEINGEYPIIGAGFCDSNNKRSVFLLEDYLSTYDNDREAAEKALLMKIVAKLNEYDWSMGFYTTGVRTYNPRKHKKVGRDSDLIQLDKRLRRYGMYSPVKQSEFTKIPYYVGYNNKHTHIDSYTIFANQVIRSSMFKDQYSAKDLDTIAKGIVGRGKYQGLKGVDFESLTDLEEKRKCMEYHLQCIRIFSEGIQESTYKSSLTVFRCAKGRCRKSVKDAFREFVR